MCVNRSYVCDMQLMYTHMYIYMYCVCICTCVPVYVHVFVCVCVMSASFQVFKNTNAPTNVTKQNDMKGIHPQNAMDG